MFLTKIRYSPGIDGQILSQLFLVGGNHEIWHKDAFKGREFKLIRNHVKSDVRTIFFLGGGGQGCTYVCM